MPVGKIISNVYETYQYDVFKKLECNRSVVESRKEKLIASFSIKSILNPITVNDKYEIVDGQGRYEARKALKLPIQYVMDDDANIEDCRRMNTYNNPWSYDDFVNSYADGGVESYILLRKAHKETGFPYYRILRLVNHGTKSTSNTERIKSGDINFTKNDFEKVIKIKYMIEEVIDALCFDKKRTMLLLLV